MSDTLRARALRLLARREHSRAELRGKLAPHADDQDALEALLTALEREGLLSDRRFAEELAHARRRRYGSQRIGHELRKKGVAGELADEMLARLHPDEVQAAREVWRKKFRQPPANARERARQVRFLQGRGFGLDVIMKVLRGNDDD
ncbi:MAG: recombination regulator RecX [Betaproteobacteria bacterium]|nr:recombination regulator RecX [Betaproteobacteria bacterium]